jgi:hypothetical protein
MDTRFAAGGAWCIARRSDRWLYRKLETEHILFEDAAGTIGPTFTAHRDDQFNVEFSYEENQDH